MRCPRSRFASLVVLSVFLGVFSGCATWSQHLGVRPDEPVINIENGACREYQSYSAYAQQLQEAYHSRASQNRAWIYVAGVLGLGVAAASGGLAAATAVGAGTLALLSISGGFSAAAFAAIDNPDLAQLYTIAANRVDQALKESDSRFSLGPDNEKRYDPQVCVQALRVLKDGVSEARTTLEMSRTNTAVAALVRAREQQKILNEVIATQQAGDPTRVTFSADITELETVPAKPEKDKSTQVTLTIKNIRLDQVAQADVKVLFGGQELTLDAPAELVSDNTYKVKFTAPAVRPQAGINDYAPVLLVGKTKQRIASQQGKKFTYPPPPPGI